MNTYKIHRVHGYDQYKQLVSKPDMNGAYRTLFFFYGTGDESSSSWCSDCRDVMPSIEKLLAKISTPNVDLALHFVYVAIDKDDWKSDDCGFRKNPDLKLTNIPTLIWLKGGREEQRLVEDECKSEESLSKCFNFL